MIRKNGKWNPNQVMTPLLQTQHQPNKLALRSAVAGLRIRELFAQILHRMPTLIILGILLKGRPYGKVRSVTHYTCLAVRVKKGQNWTINQKLFELREGLFLWRSPSERYIFASQLCQWPRNGPKALYEAPVVVAKSQEHLHFALFLWRGPIPHCGKF